VLILKPTYNFVIYVNDEELSYYQDTSIEDNLHLFSRWGYDWCLQPYLRLRARTHLKVRLSNKMLPDCINIVHSAQLAMEAGRSNYFIVCAKADFPSRDWAHFHLVQNQNQIGRNTAFIPHWVQPGLIRRHPGRKGVKRIGYAGQVFNGNLAADEMAWTTIFAAHDLEFVVLPPEACYDLSEIDLLIGIRSFSTFPYDSKPASKLVNAWHAHIPFIGGYDSAFAQLGSPGKDYFRVKSMEEVVDTVLQLKNNEALYQTTVENGLQKAEHYNDDVTLRRWEEVLEGPIIERYKKWQVNPASERSRFVFLSGIDKAKTFTKQITKKVISRQQLQKIKEAFHR